MNNDNNVTQGDVNNESTTFTPEPETKSPLTTKTRNGLVVALILFLILIAVGFVAARALPGSSMYGLKTGLLEELSQSVQFSGESKAQYQVERMENRLEEAKRLAEKDTVDQETTTSLLEQIHKHSEMLTSIITSDQSISRAAKLTILSDFASVTGAIEAVCERDPELAAFGEQVEDTRQDIIGMYRDEVDAFVERESMETLYTYIQTRLEEIGSALADPNVSEGTIDDAQVYINRVGPAVAESDFPRAITAIAEAHRFIEIEQYVGIIEEQSTSTDTQSDETGTTSTTTLEEEPEPAPAATPTEGSFEFSG